MSRGECWSGRGQRLCQRRGQRQASQRGARNGTWDMSCAAPATPSGSRSGRGARTASPDPHKKQIRNSGPVATMLVLSWLCLQLLLRSPIVPRRRRIA
eukprot:3428307-Rhodomonas_salina.1